MRSTRLVVLLAISLLLAACGGDALSPDPSSPPSAAPSATGASTGSPAAAGPVAPSDLSIGVVGAVGSVSDKGINEYTLAGAKDGATAIGAADPIVVLPSSPDEEESLLQASVEQGEQVIVVAGPTLQDATVKVSKANPTVWFVGVDHDPCANVAATAGPSPEPTPRPKASPAPCTDELAAGSPRYIRIRYADDQAGYLAGMVAAAMSKSGVIGAIAGDPRCRSCIRSMQGYARGARSVDPDIRIEVGWIATSDLAGEGERAARLFADRFLVQNRGMDVLFQADGSPDNGVIDAACAAGINAIGAAVDRALADPSAKACILTSAEDRISASVSDTIKAIDKGTATGGPLVFDASDGGVGLAPFYDAADRLPADLQARIETATAGIASGSIATCPPPPDCGRVGAPID